MQLTVVNTTNEKTLSLVATTDVKKSAITVNGVAATIIDYERGVNVYWIRRPNIAVRLGDVIEMDDTDVNLHLIVARD